MSSDTSTIFKQKDIEAVWNAIVNDEKFSVWYAPGSQWKIPTLEVGKRATFTLMPSAYNNLNEDESMTMHFTIKEVIPYEKFTYYWDLNDLLITIELTAESAGTTVQFNQEGFDYSLANLKAYLEGNELPYC